MNEHLFTRIDSGVSFFFFLLFFNRSDCEDQQCIRSQNTFYEIVSITDNDIELLSGNHNLSRLNASEDTISRLNTTRNNIVYCIEKYQITIIATEVGIGILDLPQVIFCEVYLATEEEE